MTTKLLLCTFILSLPIMSCQKESDNTNKANGESSLLDKVYEVGMASTTVGGQLIVEEDTIRSYTFEYDNLSRVVSMEILGLAGDSIIGERLSYKYHYAASAVRPWLITCNRLGRPLGATGLDSVFYTYDGDFVLSDSLVFSGGSYVTHCLPTAPGFIITSTFHRPVYGSSSTVATATAYYVNGNVQESRVDDAGYVDYYKASYLNAPNPFYRIMPLWPVNPMFKRNIFQAQPQLVSEIITDEDGTYRTQYNYALRNDGYPLSMNFDDIGESYNWLFTYK